MALNAPYTPSTVIQSTQVSNDLTGLANGSNDTATNSMSTYRSESNFDYVASGGVWSGDSYGVNRNGSMTAAVVYIGGVRLTVSVVTGHAFTASKDTYIDINGSGVPVYTEATNNAASAALAAGSLRIAIIVTGASSIAAATSVNQGQESMVLPIASSIPYQVTDSLGNLICPRDVNRKVLGYRQLVANATVASASDTQITGLSTPVIIPTGRKIRITFFSGVNTQTNAGNETVRIWDGAVGVGTNLQSAESSFVAGIASVPLSLDTETTPAATSKTYNISAAASAGTLTINGSSTITPFVRVELA